MTPEERRTAVRRLVDELYNKGNLDICDEMHAAHCTFHQPQFPIDGVRGLKEYVQGQRAAQPDLHLDVQEVIAQGDLTASRWTVGGTDRGGFPTGAQPTNKSYVMSGMSMAKWEDDRIVEQWNSYDMLGVLQQLGILPDAAELRPAR